MNHTTETSAGGIDPFFTCRNHHLGSDCVLDDASFAALSEALTEANTVSSQHNDRWFTDTPLRNLSNDSTASSSPFTPGLSISRPKLGSRFSREVIRTLKDWLAAHEQHPYPNESQMESLRNRTGLNKAQLTNWFANARRRGKVQSVRPTSPQVHTTSTPIDIIQRPGTPAVRASMDYKDPMQRWVESPPEHEPAAVGDIARAMASRENGSGHFSYNQPWQSPCAMSSASSARTSQSSECSGHCSSGSQKSLKVRRAPRKKRASTRRCLGKETTSLVTMPYQCTFCTEVFRTKYDWQRHEKSLHLPLEKWICALLGPRATKESPGEQCCVYCGETEPDDAHIEAHHYSACQERNLEERTFHRKDHLVQHLRLVHGVEFAEWSMAHWMLPIPDVRSRCGFCGTIMDTWLERTDHLADHFKSGATMASWQGDWGFDDSVTRLVETAIPPELIDWERSTLIPMKGSDPSWGTPPNAYELLKIEIEFFIQRTYDNEGHLPDNDAIQLEACRIIFAAETSSPTTTTAPHDISWLRDLIMSSPGITERARFQPVRTSRESRHFPLRILAKDHLFEQCPMEAHLQDFVLRQKVAGAVLDDAQLHHEACQIVRQMEQESSTPSDVFANWIVKGIYSGMDWLSNFKKRAAICETVGMTDLTNEFNLDTIFEPSWSRPSPLKPSVAPLDTQFPAQDVPDIFSPLPTFSEAPTVASTSVNRTDVHGRLRTLLPDDTNFYRIFDSDMRRWAASTLSPKNPNCHIPSDEEIQHQARWIMYDGDDPWNQTPADFPSWLWRFKKDVGIATDAEVVNPHELAVQPDYPNSTDEGKIKLQPQSPLLRLSAELRNMIYRFLYSEKEDIHIILPNLQGTARLRQLLKLATLRHVCRQLRLETTGMGRNIVPHQDLSAMHSFFLDNLKLVLFRTYGAQLFTRFPQDTYIQVSIWLCHLNPDSKVHVLADILEFRLGMRAMLAQGAALQRVLRDRPLPFTMDPHFDKEVASNVRIFKLLLSTAEEWQHIPDNLRVYPLQQLNEEELDSATINSIRSLS
ncbi:Homeobox-KN multi-domain protein [Pyrenophora tritici-repentis]|nr:Homeobox-KN multi-domain protein [Pyrenophora tritici-repentis]PZD04659.1 Homeobox-KN multi-domain protein [Pyrenophora tritici-repentis]PZD27046.1 Homeobox-KN multi-domain protein [Pyrenophora tritici-repentis]